MYLVEYNHIPANGGICAYDNKSNKPARQFS